MNDDTDAYIRTLETQIENKTVFLKQSTNTIKKLKKQYRDEDKQTVDPAIWKAFMKKPVMYTEKSDPIGLSLMDSSISMRNQTSLDWLELMTGEQLNYQGNLQSMIKRQSNLNKDLTQLVNLLGGEETSSGIRPDVSSNIQEENESLWSSLRKFVSDTLAKDSDTTEGMAVLRRLVGYEPTLESTDFQSTADLQKLYRLLLRSSVLDIETGPNNEKFIKLLDFIDTNLD